MANDSVLLKDLLVFTKDGEWGKGEAGEGLIEMSVIRGTDFEDVRLGDTGSVPLRYIPEQIAARKRLQPGDILLETAGGTKDQPTGRTVFLKKHFFERHQTRPFTCASFSRFLRVDSSLADSEYVYWYLKHLYFTGEMYLYHVQHTGVARFQYTEFAAKTRIPLPPLPTQRAIARILGALDDKIELNRRQSATLESLARAVFQSWFVDFDPVRARAEGRAPAAMDAATAALFPDGFDVVDGREVPRGWEVTPLDRVMENLRRNQKAEEIGAATPYIGLEHMPRKSIALEDWGFAESLESNKFAFQRGEILFGKLRPYFHKVGVAAIDGVCSTDILVLRPVKPQWFGFVLGHVSSEEFVQHTNQSSDGTRMPRTNWKDMARYEVTLPPGSVASAYNHFVISLVERIIANLHQSQTLAALRDALLPRLLSGELRVRAAERLVAERV